MRAIRSIVAGLMLAGGVVGCQNRIHDDNLALHRENREQRAKLDAMTAQLAANQEEQAPVEIPEPPVEVKPAPKPEPAPEPLPLPPITRTQLGELETTIDEVAGTVTANLPGDVFFDPGQALIRPEAKSALDKAIVVLKKDYAGKPIRVEGHTDADPIRKSKWASNEALSEERASAVKDYLIAKGVDASSVSIEGFGATKPKSQKKNENRRVELVVVVK